MVWETCDGCEQHERPRINDLYLTAACQWSKTRVQESNGKGEEVCGEWNGSLVWKTEESKERMQGRHRRALAR